jgi:enoyl-CoA hydratase/carnithine racemase
MKHLQIERQGAVVRVWLNRQQALNAINRTMLAELRQTFENLAADEEVRAVILSGRRFAFSSGFDVAWMAGLDSETVGRELGSIRALYDVIETFPRPLVAAVNGVAMGGGLLLALVADLRIASERAQFGVPEVKIGIFPSLSLVPRLERLIGLGPAKRLVLTGDPVGAEEALRIGLVDRVVPARALQTEAQALAEKLASLPPAAVRLSKAAFAAAHDVSYTDWEMEHFVRCWDTPERSKAMHAFLQNVGDS